MTRIITDHMARTLGQSIVIQNEPGAGGTISIANVTKAAPDGYTVLSIGPSVATIKDLFPNAVMDVQRDLQPVTIIGQMPLVLVAHKDVPGNDYAAMLAYMKAHPGELTFASNGRGSGGHLAGSLFKKMSGANLRYIPYRSTPQATADLIGGRVSMIWLSSIGNLAGTGAVRPVAVTLMGGRWNKFPEVPTFDEAGLKGYEATTWVSMYLPKDAPKEIAERLTAAVTPRWPIPTCWHASTRPASSSRPAPARRSWPNTSRTIPRSGATSCAPPRIQISHLMSSKKIAFQGERAQIRTSRSARPIAIAKPCRARPSRMHSWR